MNRAKKIDRPGAGVRIPLEDLADFRFLARELDEIPVSRLLHALITEVGLELAHAKAPNLKETGLISAIQREEKLTAVCSRIFERGTRSLGNGQAQSIWVPLTDAERAKLGEVANCLSWSEGKLIAECLRDAIMMGGSALPATRAPKVASLYRAIRQSSRRTETELLSTINQVLEQVRQHRQRTQNVVGREGSVAEQSILSFSVGQATSGEAVHFDLEQRDSYHALIVGGARSGKSELLRTIASDLLSKNDSDSLKLVLIDPTRVTFAVAEGSPYLLSPLISTVEGAVYHLETAISGDFPAKKRISRVVIVDDIDKLFRSADGPMRSRLERCLTNIVERGRNLGIHLLAATQRFDDVIPEPLKQNVQTRICLKVETEYASLEVIGHSGAETLIGKGDLLYSADGAVKRAQAYFIGANQLHRLFQSH